MRVTSITARPAPLVVARLEDPVPLVVGKAHVGHTQVLTELVDHARAHDRNDCGVGVRHQPPERDLRGRGVDLLSDRPDRVENAPPAHKEVVVTEPVVERRPGPVGCDHPFGVVRVSPLVLAGEEPARQRRVRTHRQPLVAANVEILLHVLVVPRVEQRLGDSECSQSWASDVHSALVSFQAAMVDAPR